MSTAPTGPEAQTYNKGSVTSDCDFQATRSDNDSPGHLQALVSREVWACSLEAARWERLLALRASVSAGTYRVSAEELADCLLRKSGTSMAGQ